VARIVNLSNITSSLFVSGLVANDLATKESRGPIVLTDELPT